MNIKNQFNIDTIIVRPTGGGIGTTTFCTMLSHYFYGKGAYVKLSFDNDRNLYDSLGFQNNIVNGEFISWEECKNHTYAFYYKSYDYDDVESYDLEPDIFLSSKIHIREVDITYDEKIQDNELLIEIVANDYKSFKRLIDRQHLPDQIVFVSFVSTIDNPLPLGVNDLICVSKIVPIGEISLTNQTRRKIDAGLFFNGRIFPEDAIKTMNSILNVITSEKRVNA